MGLMKFFGFESKEEKAEQTRLELERQALQPVEEPPNREKMTDDEFISAVFVKLNTSHPGINKNIIKAVLDYSEEVVADFLPERDVGWYGLGVFRLEFKQPEKFNLDPSKVLGPGYVFRFHPSININRAIQEMRRKVKDVF